MVPASPLCLTYSPAWTQRKIALKYEQVKDHNDPVARESPRFLHGHVGKASGKGLPEDISTRDLCSFPLQHGEDSIFPVVGRRGKESQ